MDSRPRITLMELRRRFEEIVAQAETGQQFVVTRYGRPYADIVPHKMADELQIDRP